MYEVVERGTAWNVRTPTGDFYFATDVARAQAERTAMLLNRAVRK